MSIMIALDAMGGDSAPSSVLDGASRALAKHPDVKFLIYGNQDAIAPLWQNFPRLHKSSKIIHSEEVITAHTKPTAALRSLRNSSMRLAIEAVSEGQAQAVVSAGNTGAYMALSRLLLKSIPGIDRPALPALIPSPTGTTILLDAGANLQCDAENLVQFALMGECFASLLLGKESPSIGLLNVGSEESKGHLILQETAQRLKQIEGLNFFGFIEGSDVPLGEVDVVVTDGFSGNLVLKAIEGTAQVIAQALQKTLAASIRGKLGYLIAKPSLKELRQNFDPRLHNGTLFLGLRGLAVKSHGGMDGIGFANAIEVAIRMIEQQLIDKIIHRHRLEEAA